MEFDLIDHIRLRQPSDPRVLQGIGDDCAILPGDASRDLLITTDLLLEGVHFLSDQHSLAQIARKAIAVSVSDIAAMAGIPIAAFVSLSFPRNWQSSRAAELMECLSEACAEFSVVLAGGDTTTWPGPLTINSTLYGEVPAGTAVRRNGAQPGDVICVSGPLGGSRGSRQFSFVPRVREARWLAEHCRLHAMLDLSDGVASDLRHILNASGVGAIIETAQVPVHDDVRRLPYGLSPLEHAMGDGEDFELLWTMPAEDLAVFTQAGPSRVTCYPIGRIVAGEGCEYRDANGLLMPCNAAGYVHDFIDTPRDA